MAHRAISRRRNNSVAFGASGHSASRANRTDLRVHALDLQLRSIHVHTLRQRLIVLRCLRAVHALGHRPSLKHAVARRRQNLQAGFILKPWRKLARFEHHRHAVVNFRDHRIRTCDDHRARLHCLAARAVFPFVPQPGERDHLTGGAREIVRLLTVRRVLPFVIARRRDNAAGAESGPSAAAEGCARPGTT